MVWAARRGGGAAASEYTGVSIQPPSQGCFLLKIGADTPTQLVLVNSLLSLIDTATSAVNPRFLNRVGSAQTTLNYGRSSSDPSSGTPLVINPDNIGEVHFDLSGLPGGGLWLPSGRVLDIVNSVPNDAVQIAVIGWEPAA